MEDPDYANVYELRGAGEQRSRGAAHPHQDGRLFRLAVLTLGLLCLLQGALNICLRLHFPSDGEEADISSSDMALLGQTCANISCCRTLLRKALQENLALMREREQFLSRPSPDDEGSGDL